MEFTATWPFRLFLVLIAMGAWHASQTFLSRYFKDQTTYRDGIHVLTAPANRYLHANPRVANGLLIISSLGIDVLGLSLLAMSVFGASLLPFVGLMILFGLRQLCQFCCPLPAPAGIIWRSPGIPSVLVTYHVSNDFFFSGHTALAVFGAMEIARLGDLRLAAAAITLAIFEVITVLILRAHYTMDVFTGILAAIVVEFLIH